MSEMTRKSYRAISVPSTDSTAAQTARPPRTNPLMFTARGATPRVTPQCARRKGGFKATLDATAQAMPIRVLEPYSEVVVLTVRAPGDVKDGGDGQGRYRWKEECPSWFLVLPLHIQLSALHGCVISGEKRLRVKVCGQKRASSVIQMN